MVEDSASRDSATSEETKRNYIDKVSQAVTSTSHSLSRAMLLQYILSALLLAVCIGVVSVDKEYSVLGTSLGVSRTGSLWLGGGILAVLMVAAVSLVVRENIFLDELKRLYEDLNYQVPWDEGKHPFAANDAYGALLAKYTGDTPQGALAAIYDTLAVWLLIGSWTLLPLSAQTAVLITLIWTAGFWVWAPAILFMIVTIG